MEIQEIEVFIHPDGRVQLGVHGVKGKKCLALTQELERLLGGEIIERKTTPEFDEQQQNELEQGDSIQQGW